VSRLPHHLVLLVVQADEAAHAPLRAALKAIEGTEYEIDWVTTPRAALTALDEHSHDAFLVDRSLGDPGHSGLDVARDILAHTPYAPVILLDDHADRATDLAATEAGVSDYLVHPSPATLERSLRYAITHQTALRRLAESEEPTSATLRASGSAACTRMTGLRSRRPWRAISSGRPSTSSPSTGSSTATAPTAGCSRAASPSATTAGAPRASSAPRPT
jgi:DNA-binding response OmpR family regulator